MLRSCEVKSLKGYGKDRETVVGGAQLIMDSHLWHNCPLLSTLKGQEVPWRYLRQLSISKIIRKLTPKKVFGSALTNTKLNLLRLNNEREI
jgi:hypothetical protein